MAESPANPFVGPRPFKPGETLYGRDGETIRLLDRLIADRLVLLNGPSGAGKSSLIYAAVIPKLRDEEEYLVPQPLRVGLPLPDGVALPVGVNRFVVSVLQSLEEQLPPEERLPLDDLVRLTIDDGFARWLVAQPESWGEEVPLVALVFDQFEEFLTIEPKNRRAKDEFIEQLNVVVRPRTRWSLFVMREERVAALQPYANALPTRLASRFRLELLRPDQALEVVRKTASANLVTVEPEAAELLIDNLSQKPVQPPNEPQEELLGATVEPMQLQVACRQLWEDRGGAKTIDRAMVEKLEVDSALAVYYAKLMVDACKANKELERRIREWIGTELITEQGLRDQVPEQADQTKGLSNAAINKLVEGYVIRADVRRGLTWYELAHDRLVSPILANNRSWLEASLEPWQQRAALWVAGKRSPALLLQAGALADAEVWATKNRSELVPTEEEFLERSVEARRVEQDKMRADRRQKWLVRLVGIAIVVIAGAVWRMNGQRQWNALLAADLRLPALLQKSPAEGLLSAIDVVNRNLMLNDGVVLPSVQAHLARALDASRERSAWRLRRSTLAVAVSAHQAREGPAEVTVRQIAVGLADGTVQRFQLDPDRELDSFRDKPGGPIRSLTFSHDGWLAAARNRGVTVWNQAGGDETPKTWRWPEGITTGVVFLPGGHLLAATVQATNGPTSLIIADVDKGTIRFVGKGKAAETQPVARGAPGETYIATKSAQGAVVWSLSGKLRSLLQLPNEDPVEAVDLVITPEGDVQVAAGSLGGYVAVWKPFAVPGPQLVGLFRVSEKSVDRVAFVGDGRLVMAATSDGGVRTYTLEGEKVWQPFPWFAGPAGGPRLAVFPDGRSIAVAGDTLSVIDTVNLEVHFPLAEVLAESRNPDEKPHQEPEVLERTSSAKFLGESYDLLVGGRKGVRRWMLEVPRGSAALSKTGFTAIDSRLDSNPLGDVTSIAAEGANEVMVFVGVANGDGDKVCPCLLQVRNRRGQLLRSENLAWPPTSVDLTPDARTAIIGGSGGQVELWDVSEPYLRLRQTLRNDKEGQGLGVWSVAVDPTSGRLAAAGEQGVYIWEKNGRLVKHLPAESVAKSASEAAASPGSLSRSMTKVLFHRRDGTLFVGTSEGRVQRFDRNGGARSMDERGKVQGYWEAPWRGLISALAIDERGETLFASGPGGVKSIDLATGETLDLEVHGQNKDIRALALSRDGRLLAGVSDKDGVYLWRAGWREWLSEACGRLKDHAVFRLDPRPPAYDVCAKQPWR